MFVGNFYEQTITDQSTLIVNSFSLKNKDWERGRLNREEGLNRGFTVLFFFDCLNMYLQSRQALQVVKSSFPDI